MRVWMRFFLVFSKGMFLNRNYEIPGSLHLGALPRALFLLTRGGGGARITAYKEALSAHSNSRTPPPPPVKF